jgi:hypothetical protein
MKKIQKKIIFLAFVFLVSAASISADSIPLLISFVFYSLINTSNITVAANQTFTYNLQNQTNITIDLYTDSNVSGNISVYASHDDVNEEESLIDLNKFFLIETAASINDSITSAMIYIYYDDSDLITQSGTISEYSLRMYYYNTAAWQQITSGVNTVENYVWGNVSHFGKFAVFGIVSAAVIGNEASTNRSSYSSKCWYKWECSDWNICQLDGIQTRFCINEGNCSDSNHPPETKRKCTYVPAAEETPIIQETPVISPEPEILPEQPVPSLSPAKQPSAIPLSLYNLIILVLAVAAVIIIIKLKIKTKK